MLAAIVEDLRFRRLPPRAGDDDPLARAWAEANEPEGMIELLVLGGQIGLYGVDGRREDLDTDRRPVRWLFRLRTPEGKYVRVDFSREGGAAALRALVPAIAPYGAWAAAIEAERARTTDPVAQLVLDLRRTGAVDPRWEARWTLPRAWRASEDSMAMRALLEILGREDLLAEAQRAIDEATPPPGPQGTHFTTVGQLEPYRRAHEAWLVTMIRSAVPDPPPLPGPASDPPPSAPLAERAHGYRIAPVAAALASVPAPDRPLDVAPREPRRWTPFAIVAGLAAAMVILRWLVP